MASFIDRRAQHVIRITCSSWTDSVFFPNYLHTNLERKIPAAIGRTTNVEWRRINVCPQTEFDHLTETASPIDSTDSSINMTNPTSDGGQLSIQQLLALAKQRAQHVQSKLTLRQLKEQARVKARSSSNYYSQRMQPKRTKRTKTNQSSHASSKQHSEIIKMNTGILYLCRGEHRRVRFVRNK